MSKQSTEPEQFPARNLPGKEDDRPRYISKTKSVGSSVVAAEVAPSTAKIRSNWMMAHFIDVGQGDATLFGVFLALLYSLTLEVNPTGNTIAMKASKNI